MIPSKTLFMTEKKERKKKKRRKKKKEKEERKKSGGRGSWTDRMLQLVEKIKAHGILMDRGTRSFTLDQFSRMRWFSRDKRCIKPCTYATRIGGPPTSPPIRDPRELSKRDEISQMRRTNFIPRARLSTESWSVR